MRETMVLLLGFWLLAAACGRQPLDYATAVAQAEALVEARESAAAYEAFDRGTRPTTPACVPGTERR